MYDTSVAVQTTFVVRKGKSQKFAQYIQLRHRVFDYIKIVDVSLLIPERTPGDRLIAVEQFEIKRYDDFVTINEQLKTEPDWNRIQSLLQMNKICHSVERKLLARFNMGKLNEVDVQTLDKQIRDVPDWLTKTTDLHQSL